MADDFDIDAVLDRMMHRESGGKVSAVGKAGEIGLHQIKPDIFRHYGIDPKLGFNPVVNRYVAKRYLTDLRSSFNGDMRKAVMAYNAGPGRIRSGYVPASTKAYVDYALGGLSVMRAPTAGGADRQTLPLMRAPSSDSMAGDRLPLMRAPSASAMDDGGLPLMRAPSAESVPGSIRSELLPEALKTSPPKNTLEIPSRRGASDSSGSMLEIPSRFRLQTPSLFQPNIAQPAATDIGQRLLSSLGPASAYAEDVPPASMIPEGKYADFSNGKTYTNKGGKVIEVPKPPAAPEPFGAKAASWLPMAGQFAGESLGAIGGAAIPGAGESGVPEYLGATAGGAAGSAAGAELENLVRKHYKLPPVSVGSEAAWGGAGSAVGGLLPLVGRFRKAARLAKQAGSAYTDAASQALQREAEAGKTLGIGPRVGKVLETAPASVPRQAYEATRAAGLRELGQEYNKVLQRFYPQRLVTNEGAKELFGDSGRILELEGKSLRQSIEGEFAKHPKTVAGAQGLLMLLRQKMRQLNPDRDAVAIMALRKIEKGLEFDRDQVICSANAAIIKNIDYHYATQLQRFPLSRVRRAIQLPQAAAEIIAHKPGDEGRVLQVLGEAQRTSNIGPLRRAVAARIWQIANVEYTANPAERMTQVIKAIEGIKPSIFDALYGKGAQKTWLATAKTLSKRQMELLEHPDEAGAIRAEVGKYLRSEPALVKSLEHVGIHRIWFEAMMLGGGALEGHLPLAVGTVFSLEVYRALAHSQPALKLLQAAATAKAPKMAARLLIAALNAGMRGTVETATGDTDNAL